MNDVETVYDQEIAWEVFLDIVFDIGAAASLEGVVVKGGPERFAHGGGTSLEDAVSALRAGAHGVQLRYVHQGATWWDTVMALPSGRFRLIRSQPPVLTPTDGGSHE